MTIFERVDLIPWLLMAADLKQDYYFILHTNIPHLVGLITLKETRVEDISGFSAAKITSR